MISALIGSTTEPVIRNSRISVVEHRISSASGNRSVSEDCRSMNARSLAAGARRERRGRRSHAVHDGLRLLAQRRRRHGMTSIRHSPPTGSATGATAATPSTAPSCSA